MDIEGIGTVRNLITLFIAALFLLAACGGESSSDMETDTVETVLTTPQEAITGAYNLIDEANTVVDAANERTDELETMMEDF